MKLLTEHAWQLQLDAFLNTICYFPVITTWRAHVEVINSLDFIDEHKLLITASNDCSVRLWNKDGDYIGQYM